MPKGLPAFCGFAALGWRRRLNLRLDRGGSAGTRRATVRRCCACPRRSHTSHRPATRTRSGLRRRNLPRKAIALQAGMEWLEELPHTTWPCTRGMHAAAHAHGRRSTRVDGPGPVVRVHAISSLTFSARPLPACCQVGMAASSSEPDVVSEDEDGGTSRRVRQMSLTPEAQQGACIARASPAHTCAHPAAAVLHPDVDNRNYVRTWVKEAEARVVAAKAAAMATPEDWRLVEASQPVKGSAASAARPRPPPKRGWCAPFPPPGICGGA